MRTQYYAYNWGERERAPSCGLDGRAVTIDIYIDIYIYIYIQVNKKFHKFERVYRDCIKRTRDKTRIHCIPHDAPGT